MNKRPSYHFLHFTRKEKNGTVFILVIICLMLATPFFYSSIFKEKKTDETEFKDELAFLKRNPGDSTKRSYNKDYRENNSVTYYYTEINKDSSYATALFYFDPNTLSAAGWKKLGLADKTITTIQNYLSKGGRFREQEDIKKIWGLDKGQAEQLLPYVRIAQPENNSSRNFPVHEKTAFHERLISVIDINQADSANYISLPGIGPGYAKRIMKFRDKLGGFYKIEQVAETFGLPDSTFQKIKGYLKISPENIRKININTASLDELKEHPYIRYQLANAIVQFRSQHGNFSFVDDIKKIMIVTDDVFMKISPYLIVNKSQKD